MANAATLASKPSSRPAPTQAQDAAGGPPTQAGPVNKFVAASREHVEPGDDRTRTIAAAASQAQTGIDVPASGYLRHVVLDVTAAGGDKGGASVAVQDDAPWSAISNVVLQDVNGAPIVGPMSGYDLYLANKYGAYVHDSDPAVLPSFTDVDADGDFSFKLRIPVEISARDALGALPNMDSSATYKVGYDVAAGTSVYATAPANAMPGLRVRQWLETWTQPPAADLRGIPNEQTPPALGTTQRWSKSHHNFVAADQRFRLSRVGNQLRTLVFVVRDSAGDRDSDLFPDELRVEVDGQNWLVTSKRLILDQMRERYGFDPDEGVFVLDFSHDLDGKPGNELRTGYLPTTQATRIEIAGTFGGTGVLEVLTNDVAARAVIADG